MAAASRVFGRIAVALSAVGTGWAASKVVPLWRDQNETNVAHADNAPAIADSVRKSAPVVLERSSVYGWGHALNILGVGPKQVSSPTKVRPGHCLDARNRRAKFRIFICAAAALNRYFPGLLDACWSFH